MCCGIKGYIVLRMQNNKKQTGQEMEYLPDKM